MRVSSLLMCSLELIQWLIMSIPGRLGVFIRRAVYRFYIMEGRWFDLEAGVVIKGLKNVSFGNGVCIERNGTLFASGGSLKLGNDCYINRNVQLGSNGDAPLTLGNSVMVGPNVVMDTSRHNDARTDIPMKLQGLSYSPITVGDDVWIGANAVIVCGVTVGDGSIIGAGAVVTRDVPPRAVVAGVPARVVRIRGER